MAFINLYSLLVEGVFGSLLVAAIGISIIFIVIGFFSNMSQMLIFTILFCFLLAYGIGYAGAVVAVPAFIFSGVYLAYTIMDWWYSRR